LLEEQTAPADTVSERPNNKGAQQVMLVVPGWGFSQSGSMGLDFQKGNLRPASR